VLILIGSLACSWLFIYLNSNPVEDYAKSKHLPSDIIEKLKPLGYDRQTDYNEKALIDDLAQLGEYINSSSVRFAIDSIVKDGKITADEVYVPHEWDTDHDYVSDFLEITKYHTDPTKMDSFGKGIDDFNAIYAYGLDPHNQVAVRDFLQKIPNVVANHWNQTAGGVTDWSHLWEKYVTISLRDPLIQWLAKHAEIVWYTSPSREKTGTFYVNGETIWQGVDPLDNRSLDPPSYYFTHGRLSTCVPSSLANLVILELMGYNAINVGGMVSVRNETEGHSWTEAYINGKVWVVNFNTLVLREGFYQKINWTVTDSNFGESVYDTDWYTK
jgi:hypothetical protein